MASQANDATGLGEASHHRFAINTITNSGSLVLSIAVGFWYTPYMIRHLGVAVYGLIPLSSSITNYLTIITAAVCTTVARYITVDIARGDIESANRHFNTFLVIATGVATALMLLAVGFSYLLPEFFNIPAGQEWAAQVLFLSVTAAFLLSTVANTFQSAIWVSNRFEIRSLIESGAILIRVSLVVLLFHLWTPSLWQLSIAFPVTALYTAAGDVIACRKLVPSLRVRFSDFDRKELGALWNTSRWMLVSQVGGVLFFNLDLVLANTLLGPVEAGRYAPLIQWVFLLRTLGLSIALVLSPPLVVRHAQGDVEGLLRVLRQASKFLGLIVGLPATLMCGFAGPLLGTWLGPSFQDLAPLTWWLVLPLCVEASQLHLSAVWIAADKLRVISLQTVACGVAYIGLAVLLVRGFHWGLYGIAVASAVASLLRNGVLSPIYTATITHLPRWTLASYAWKALFGSFVFAALTAMAFVRMAAGSWSKLALAAAPVSLAYCAITYFALLNGEERRTLRRIIFARRAEP